MATHTLPAKYDELTGLRTQPKGAKRDLGLIDQFLHALASLKLTVVLLGMGIFIVLVGTLAQVEMDMGDVLKHYFAAWLAWINIQVFFPTSFFPDLHVPAFFIPFPGGALIGLAMILNLIAAHTIRFRVHAKGIRLVAGLVLVAAGTFVTWLVIAMGHNKQGLQGEPFFSWPQFWFALKIVLTLAWTLMFYPVVRLTLRSQAPRFLEAGIVAAVHCGLTALLAYLISTDAALGPSSLRILWQLLQGLLAAGILLAGCLLLFRKRAGIVLLHAGILLMMLGQFIATRFNQEEQISLREGETTSFAENISQAELAIIDRVPADHDNVVVIPMALLEDSQQQKSKISDAQLPFDVEVVKSFENSSLRHVQSKDSNLATAGLGLTYVAVPTRSSGGASVDAGVDLPSTYVRLLDKKTGKPLGTYLFSLIATFNDHLEEIPADGKTYHVALRFKRSYKPYSITLKDVAREDYTGTSMVRSFASVVQIQNPSRKVDREVRIWMNNPLCYAGETFYQHKYDPGERGIEVTQLQVVSNIGWMIPYVACMIVGTGLVTHFWGTLIRFLLRRERELFERAQAEVNPYEQPVAEENRRRRTRKGKKLEALPLPAKKSIGHLAFPLVIVAVGCLWLLWPAVVQRVEDPRGMDVKAFGELPVLYEGRVKPMDTMARNALRVLSNRESFKDSNDKRQPAIRWLLDVIADPETALNHRVVKIENLELLQTLGLQRRKGYCFAINEFNERLDEFKKQVDLANAAARKDPASLSTYQRKVLELDNRLSQYLLLVLSFQTLPLPDKIPTAEDLRNNREEAMQNVALIGHLLQEASNRDSELEQLKPPRAIPAGDDWAPASTAYTAAYRARMLNMISPDGEARPVNEGALTFRNMLQAYGNKQASQFNRELGRFQKFLATAHPAMYHPRKVQFEAYYNRFAPFFHAQWAYVLAFVLAAVAWLGWSRPLNRAAFWLIALTFAVHTFAIVSRIYISGRPPVTNLYSSAIFIGWAAAAAGIGLEMLYRIGIGNIIAAVGGFATLIIASFLATSGETMTALEAVLDTQFWLSTHVVCVTLGYSATFVAGLLGLLYILGGVFSKSFSNERGRDLIREIYGTLCFALIFSFIGTVLGGLWADDSWGRFWGWDPKENGALIIVLWNALVLHARWDGMVRDRGLAVLAIGGNITTGWSWFGVNELGIGLHSYGFTEGVLLALGLFVVSQLVMIGIGCLPKRHWKSELGQAAG